MPSGVGQRPPNECGRPAALPYSVTLGAAESHMEGRDYLAGGFTIADTITGHAIIMSRRLGADFSACPNLNAYADRLEARDAFKAAEAA